MDKKLEASKDLIPNQEEENNIEKNEELASLAEQAFVDFDSVESQAMAENMQLSEDMANSEVSVVCAQAEEQIKEASSKNESILMKLFNNLADKADKKWDELKNKRNFKSVSKDLSYISEKRYSDKYRKYKKEKDEGEPQKYDKYFDKLYKNFPQIVENYNKLNKEYFDDYNFGRLDDKFELNLKEIIFNKIEKGDIEEALSLWQECPRKESSNSYGAEMAEKIGNKILSEASEDFPETTEGNQKKISVVKEGLADHPDIYYLYLRKYCDRDYSRRKDFQENGEYLEPLQKSAGDPSKEYIFNFISVGYDFPKNKITPEIIQATFKELLKNNPYEISKNLEIFQEEINKLDSESRYELIKKTANYHSDFINYGSYFELSPREVNLAIGLQEDGESKNWDEDTRSEKMTTFIDRVKSESPLMLLANVNNFDITPDIQNMLLQKIVDRGQMVEYAQLFAHPEKYPSLTMEDINNTFNKYLEYSGKGNGYVLGKILYHQVNIESSQRETLINDFLSVNNRHGVIDFLAKNRSTLSPDEVLLFEEDHVNKAIGDSSFSFQMIGELKKFAPQNLERLFSGIRSISWLNFLELFFSSHNERLPINEKYFDVALNKLNDYNEFYAYLNNNLENKEISPELHQNLLDKMYQFGYLSAIIKMDAFKSDPESQSLIVERIVQEGTINDLSNMLQFIRKVNLVLPEESEKKLYSRVIELVDDNNFSLITSYYHDDFARILNIENNEDLVDIIIEKRNGIILGYCLNLGLTNKSIKKIADAIVSFGDSKSRVRLFGEFPYTVDYQSEEENPEKVNYKTVTDLVEVMIAKGEVQELTNLLDGIPSKKGYGSESLPVDKLNEIKEKIINSQDQQSITTLFYRYNNGYINLSQEEKEKIADFITTKCASNPDVTRTLLEKNEDFGLSSSQIEDNLINLQQRASDFFIDILDRNFTNNYFQLDEAVLNKIITDYVALGNGQSYALFSLYTKHNENRVTENTKSSFSLNKEQFSVIVTKIESSDNLAGDFLVKYIALEKNRSNLTESQEDDNLILSEKQKSDLLVKYLGNACWTNTEVTKTIFENYPDIFENVFMKEIILKNNLQIVNDLLDTNQEIISQLLTKNKAKTSEYLQTNELADKSNNVYKFYALLNKIGIFSTEDYKNLDTKLALEKNDRNKILKWTLVFGSVTDHKRGQVFDELVGQNIYKKFEEFENKYKISGKGKTILKLLAASEYKRAIESQKDLSTESVLNSISKSLEKYDQILSLYNPNNIPKGLQTSIGMEYEVTSDIADPYKEKTGHYYNEDAPEISEIAGVGKGADAVHEFAPSPTDNPYLMLLEMQLLQELEFIDFNFKGEDNGGYEKESPIGYHLTVGGEQGLKNNSQTNFLQNIVVASNLGGVCSSKKVEAVGRGRGSIRERDAFNEHNTKVFDKRTSSVELRSFAIDKWEQFERAILVSYNASIAIQAIEKFTDIKGLEELKLFNNNIPANSTSLYEFLQNNNLLKEEIEDEKIKEIIYLWIKVQIEALDSFKDHNENFIFNETSGYFNEDDEWVDAKEYAKRDNEKAFKSIIKGVSPEENLKQYFNNNLQINSPEFFETISPELVNKFIGINNLYIKGDNVNIGNTLSTTIENGDRVMSDNKDEESSIFDKNGQIRKGIYYIQGSTEKMLVNRAQKSLLNFVYDMQSILQSSADNKSEILAA